MRLSDHDHNEFWLTNFCTILYVYVKYVHAINMYVAGFYKTRHVLFYVFFYLEFVIHFNAYIYITVNFHIWMLSKKK